MASQRGSSTYCPLTGTALACRGVPMQKPEATTVDAMSLLRLRRCMIVLLKGSMVVMVLRYRLRYRRGRRRARYVMAMKAMPVTVVGSGTGTPRMLALPGVLPNGEEPEKLPGVTRVGGMEFAPVPKLVTANSQSSPG